MEEEDDIAVGFAPARALPSLHALRSEFPEAPKAELRRFARKRPDSPKDAVTLYRNYAQWRVSKGTAASLAHAHAAVPAHFCSGTRCQGPAKDGTRVIFVEMCRMDLAAHSAQTYVLALGYLIDEAFSRDEEGHLTVVVDVRGIEGAPNPKPTDLMPFIREGAKVLPKMFPDRMKRIVVYPVPWMASMLVAMVKRMLDESTREKLLLVPGDEKSSDCPVDGLSDILTLDSLPPHVWHRHKSLSPGKGSSARDNSKTASGNSDADNGSDADSFFSASEGESREADFDVDIESGLINLADPVMEHVRRPARCWWRLRCRMCGHRSRHKQ